MKKQKTDSEFGASSSPELDLGGETVTVGWPSSLEDGETGSGGTPVSKTLPEDQVCLVRLVMEDLVLIINAVRNPEFLMRYLI